MNLPDSPYRGLSAFGESELDALFFFGRERETQLVADNLVASRLTVLYGASGVGKTSILRAGVSRRLRALPERPVVVVFDDWSPDTNGALASAIADEAGIEALPTVVETVEAVAGETELYLVLDQIEELFLYEDGRGEHSITDQLPELIVRPDLRAHVALGVREDALAQLDVLKTRVRGLLANRLRLDHLDRDEAREAISGPIRRWNDLGGTEWRLDDELVETVLDEVAAGRVAVGGAGRGTTKAAGDDGRIETPYLQLVMERLWEVERAEGSGVLRAVTLSRLGGASRIVRDHLDGALDSLSEPQQEAAARMFDHLVTPSGTKISHSVRDLAQFASTTSDTIRPVLAHLAALRILRSGGSDDGGTERRYEIFHDVLADAVLEWRTRWYARRVADAARLDAERRRRRAFAVAGIALAALAVMTAVTVFALQQRHQAIVQRREAKAQAVAARSEERIARARALIATALSRLDTDPQRSLGLALQAARLEHTDEIGEVLRSALVRAPLRLILPAHAGARGSAVFSPDGRLVLTNGADGTARLFDARTGRLVRILHHRRAVTDALFNGSGTVVATASLDGTVGLWQTSSGRLLRLLRHGAPLAAVSFSRTGDLVATAGGDDIRVWRNRTGRLVRDIRVATGARSESFSPDAHSLVVTGTDRFARVYAVPGGRLLFAVSHQRRVTSATFSPAGDVLATTSLDRTAGLWDAHTGQPLHLLKGHHGPVLLAAFSRGGKLLVTAAADNEARVWNVSRGRRVAVLVGHRAAVRAAAFSADAAYIVTASDDHDARVWETAGGHARTILRGHVAPVHTASFDRSGTRVVTASADGTARVWDSGTGTTLHIVGRQPGPVLSASVDADGSLVVAAGAGHAARIWRTGHRRPLRILRQPTAVDDVSLSPDGSLVVAAGADGTARVWRVTSRTLLARLPHGREPVVRVAFNRDGSRIATAGADGVTKIWPAAGGHPLAVLRDRGPVTAVAFSPDGKFVLTVSHGRVRIWNEVAGRPARTLDSGPGTTNAVFSPDGNFVLTSGPNADARLWESGKVVRTLRESVGARGVASFSPDGRWIVTAGTVSAGLWDASSAAPLLFLRGHSGRITGALFAGAGRVVTAGLDGTIRAYRCLVCGPTNELIALAKAREARIARGG